MKLGLQLLSVNAMWYDPIATTQGIEAKRNTYDDTAIAKSS